MTNSLLPINATEFERSLESASARISDVPVLVRDSQKSDACPVALLPWLADAFSVDTWDPAWTEEQKRQTIKDSVFVHRHKGTIGAVKRALASLGLDVQVQEWFNQIPEGDPFTFRLLVKADQTGADKAALTRVRDVVTATKNLRSHVAEIVPQVVTTAGPTIAAVSGVGTNITVDFDEAGFSLLIEGAASGMDITEQAVDDLHTLVAVKLPANYW